MSLTPQNDHPMFVQSPTQSLLHQYPGIPFRLFFFRARFNIRRFTCARPPSPPLFPLRCNPSPVASAEGIRFNGKISSNLASFPISRLSSRARPKFRHSEATRNLQLSLLPPTPWWLRGCRCGFIRIPLIIVRMNSHLQGGRANEKLHAFHFFSCKYKISVLQNFPVDGKGSGEKLGFLRERNLRVCNKYQSIFIKRMTIEKQVHKWK